MAIARVARIAGAGDGGDVAGSAASGAVRAGADQADHIMVRIRNVQIASPVQSHAGGNVQLRLGGRDAISHRILICALHTGDGKDIAGDQHAQSA